MQHVLPCRPRCSIQNVNINILVEEKQLAFSLILMVKDFPTQPGTPWGLFVSSLSSGILGWCSFSWAKKHLQLMVKQLFSNLTFPPHTFDSFLYPCFLFSVYTPGYFHSTRTIPGSCSNTTNSLLFFFSPLILPDPSPMWIIPRIPFLFLFPTLCIHALNYLLFVPASPSLWLDLCVYF